MSKQWQQKWKCKRINLKVLEAEAEAANFRKLEAKMEVMYMKAEAEAHH